MCYLIIDKLVLIIGMASENTEGGAENVYLNFLILVWRSPSNTFIHLQRCNHIYIYIFIAEWLGIYMLIHIANTSKKNR